MRLWVLQPLTARAFLITLSSRKHHSPASFFQVAYETCSVRGRRDKQNGRPHDYACIFHGLIFKDKLVWLPTWLIVPCISRVGAKRQVFWYLCRHYRSDMLIFSRCIVIPSAACICQTQRMSRYLECHDMTHEAMSLDHVS
jgi:hypothetical protein